MNKSSSPKKRRHPKPLPQAQLAKEEEQSKALQQEKMAESLVINNDEDDLNRNEFGLTVSPVEGKDSSLHSPRLPLFRQLSLLEQQTIMKECVSQVQGASKPLRILFRHYCTVKIQQHYETVPNFDCFPLKNEILTLNRFMLFCRECEVIKNMQLRSIGEEVVPKAKAIRRSNIYNRLSVPDLVSEKHREGNKTAQTPTHLMHIFKRNADNFKYMLFDKFLFSLVQIALAMFQDHQSKKYMQVLLQFLGLDTHSHFTTLVRKLNIHCTNADICNAYGIKVLAQPTPPLLSCASDANHHTAPKLQIKIKKQLSVKNMHPVVKKKETINHQKHQQHNIQSSLQQGRQILHIPQQVQTIEQEILTQEKDEWKDTQKNVIKSQNGSQSQSKRNIKKSIIEPLPKIKDNRYFKPIEHNNHLNIYRQYLQSIPPSSSVSKYRITGYATINALSNPETVDKEAFTRFLEKARKNIQQQEQDTFLRNHIEEPNFSRVNSQVRATVQKIQQQQKQMSF